MRENEGKRKARQTWARSGGFLSMSLRLQMKTTAMEAAALTETALLYANWKRREVFPLENQQQ
jgi:hypothetical protein